VKQLGVAAVAVGHEEPLQAVCRPLRGGLVAPVLAPAMSAGVEAVSSSSLMVMPVSLPLESSSARGTGAEKSTPGERLVARQKSSFAEPRREES
jgi:hypothetical protein